ncbi:MAG: hypothetical protein V7647_78 [Acidobacteriota bacterium]|jgi:hypothetical protein
MRFTYVVLACCGLVAPAAALAQGAAASGAGFTTLAPAGTAVEVVEESGAKDRGRLLRFDGDSLTIESDGRERTVNRRDVSRVYRRADSVMNGLFIGLGVGAGIGIPGAVSMDCGGILGPTRRCTGSERANMVVGLGGILGGLGMGIGVGLDALVSHRHLLYDGHNQKHGAIVTVFPKVMRSGTGLLVTTAW